MKDAVHALELYIHPRVLAYRLCYFAIFVHTAVMCSSVKILSVTTLCIVVTNVALCQNEWKRRSDDSNTSEYYTTVDECRTFWGERE